MLQPAPDLLSLINGPSAIFLNISRAMHLDTKLVLVSMAFAMSLEFLGLTSSL